MCKVIYILFCLLIFGTTRAQVNLVLNPSFEDLDSCSKYTYRLDVATYWDAICTNTLCQTILANSCNASAPSNTYSGISYQMPRTGNGYATQDVFSPPPPNTLYRNFRMYSIGHLSSVLINGKAYCGKLYINLDNASPYKVNQFGMYVDDGTVMSAQPTCNNVINVMPQVANNPAVFLGDTLNWMKIEGVFIANGTESRVTFGNFKNDASTIGIATGFATGVGVATYNIDDISVIPMEITAYAGSDATICVTDSIHLGRPQEVGLECLWYKPTIATPFASTSDIWFKPTQTGNYTFIQRMDNCAITWDTVNITVIQDCSLLLPIKPIPNVFTPNADGINDVWEFSLGLGNTLTSLSVYNRWGNIIHQTTNNQSQTTILWDGRTTSGEACSEGVYFYALEYKDSKGDTQKKNGYVSLLR